MNKIIFLISILNGFSHASTNCPSSSELVARDWVQHDSSEFSETYLRLTHKISDDLSSFKRDLSTDFDSPYLGKRIHFESWDDVRTPDLEMFGDIVFYFDKQSQEPIEIRWYENNKKHFVTSGNCSCDETPLAENALF